jgi:variant SH3 domain-containing protein
MGNKPYRVITEYISPYPDSILFHMGDFVHVGIEFDDDPDWKNWIRCNGDGGKET